MNSMHARIGWRIKFSEIIFDNPLYLVMQSVPTFPGCNTRLDERGIVWDVFALIDSIKRPGAHQLLTSDCGYAPDADFNEAVLVSHPDAGTIVWELDVCGLRSALDETLSSAAADFIRLVFDREDYESDIRAMLRELQHYGKTPLVANALTDIHGLKHLLDEYPNHAMIRVGMLEPDIRGMAFERLLKLDADAAWTQEPLWPLNTVVEFGFFVKDNGHELIKVNGRFPGAFWPGWYFTRWQALTAFKGWLAYTRRAWRLHSRLLTPAEIGKNEFVLLREDDRVLCHAAGRRLAATVQSCLDEGETAPGVTVRYQECPLPAAEIETCLGDSRR